MIAVSIVHIIFIVSWNGRYLQKLQNDNVVCVPTAIIYGKGLIF